MLLATSDDLLRATVVRLVAAAGVDVSVESDPAAVLRTWAAASVVLVGVDAVSALAHLRPSRRARVWLVGEALTDDAYRDALTCGAEGAMRIPEDESHLLRVLTDAGDGDSSPALTIGVMGGSGGVGASTFATAVALSSSLRFATVLVDADVLGAGVDHLLGLEPGTGVRWDALLATGRLSGRSIREALPRREALSVLAWPQERRPTITEGVARDVLSAVVRGFAVVVVDLARHSDPLTDEILPRCDLVLVVTTTTVPALVAAARTVERVSGVEVGLVVRRRRPGGLEAEEMGRFLGRPVVAEMNDQRGLDEDVGLGVGPLRRARGPLGRAANRIVEVAAAKFAGEVLR